MSDLGTGTGYRVRVAALSLVLLYPLTPNNVAAQTGGGSGSSSGGSAAGSGAAGGASSIGAPATAGAPSSGIGSTGAARIPSPFPTVPQAGQGGAQVPSAANSEPVSPANRQAAPLGQADTGANGTAGASGTSQPLPGSQRLNSGSPTGAQSTDTLPGSEQQTTGAGGILPGQPSADPTMDPTALSSGGSSRLGDNRQGAAGATLDECMKVWEPSTHMTKDEWRRTCERTLTEYPDIEAR